MNDELRPLIRRGRDLDQQIKSSTDELKKIKARLITAGAGEYAGTDGAKALVIFPAPSLKPNEDAIREVKRIAGPKKFLKLFVETVVLTPVKGFREVAAALLEPDAAADVIEACEQESSPRVSFS